LPSDLHPFIVYFFDVLNFQFVFFRDLKSQILKVFLVHLITNYVHHLLQVPRGLCLREQLIRVKLHLG
jgi:hypothetical protein